MTVKKHTKKMYNKFGKEYMRTRNEKNPERMFNEGYELPSMLRAVGNVKGKSLLDMGCGAGIHAKNYVQKGAKVCGFDISKTMVEMAKENCPTLEFKIGSMEKIPFNNTFDIIIASLCLDYIDDIVPIFKEVSAHLKKNGMFYFSSESPHSVLREKYKDKDVIIRGIGTFVYKNKRVILGNPNKRMIEYEMVPGMTTKSYLRPLRDYLKAFQESGMEFIDIIDCKPNALFKKNNPEQYEKMIKVPLFSIYVARKK